MKKKIVYVVSNVNKAAHFEWIANSSIARDFDLSFILLNRAATPLQVELLRLGVSTSLIEYRGKGDLPRAIAKIVRLFRRSRPDLVHAHLLDASLAALTAARITGVRNRLYTRHHSNLHHVSHPHAVYYDRYNNRLATRIVAACDNVRQVLIELEGVEKSKVSVVHFGFDLEKFRNVSTERVQALRSKYALDEKHPVVGVISRYMKYKGIQYIIPAFEQLRRKYPEAVLFLANTSGTEHAQVIRGMLQTLPSGSYREVPFEEDFAALYGLFDVFVHAPVDKISEAFGQVYIEALAAKVPSVFTLSGVASEFAMNQVNSLVVPPQNAESIHGALAHLLGDQALRERLVRRGTEDVAALFPLEKMIQGLTELYSRK